MNQATEPVTATHSLNDAKPIPPRYWWLKRILIACGGLMLVLLVVRLWWGWEASKRLQAEIDRIIAAGEPLFPADFNPPEIRPEENAAVLYLEAESLLNLAHPSGVSVDELIGHPSGIRRRLDEVRRLVATIAEALALVRRAGGREKVDWGTRVTSPSMNFVFVNQSGHRQLSKALSIAALVHAERGDDVEALHTIRDAHRFTEAICEEPFLISNLIGIACRRRVARDMEHVAPRIELRRIATDGEPVAGPELYGLASSLLAQLLDESDEQRAFIRAMQSERMLRLDAAEILLRGDVSIRGYAQWLVVPPSLAERAALIPFHPLVRHYTLNELRTASSHVSGARQANRPAAMAAMQPALRDEPSLNQALSRLFGVYLGSNELFVYLHFASLAETRMAAIALAIRLYQVDHGRRPETLDALVPDYLPAVPLDPLAAEDRPIGYLPYAEKPILYSVGENESDDGGSYSVNRAGDVDRRSLDLPLFLNGDRPSQRPGSSEPDAGSGQRDEDRGDVQPDGREADQDHARQPQP